MYGYYSVAELLIKYGANVDAGDCSGSTPLHIASCHGVPSLVSLLVKNGADIDAGSLNGSTPLHSAAACFAKTVFRTLFDLGCDHYTTDDEGMTALHYVVKDVNVVGSEYLQDLYARQPKDWIEHEKDFSQQARSTNCADLLNWVTYDLVYTMNTALQVGLDVNCRDVSGLTPLLVYLRTGGRHMSKVLVKHNVEMEITCGDSFENSVFHLASYHKLHYLHYLFEFLLGSDNWQKYLQTENAIFDYFIDRYDDEIYGNGNVGTIKTGDGPLTLAILAHPNGAKVIDECFDAEGYNALHRAAQGANVIAVQKYLSLGANPLVKTSDGFSPLWLSVFHAVKYRLSLNLDSGLPSVLTFLEVELASLSASAILRHVLQNLNTTMNIGCDGSLSNINLYHLAASRGMWQFVEHLLSGKRIRDIDVNCPNKDGITPMYLAKFIGGDSCELDSPWCKVVEVIKKKGGTLQYPPLESEYFLFQMFYKRFANKLYLHLTEEEMTTLVQDNKRRDCQNYTTGAVDDLLKAYDDFERVVSDYQDKRDECVALKKDCPTENYGLPHLDYVLLHLDKQQAMKTSFFLIRNCFTNFLVNELKQVRKLFLNTIKSYSEIFSNNSRNNSERQKSKIKLRAREDPQFIGVNTCSF
ncbi:hypothetical protein ACROYT_G002960 [Oculina patagonica]